jgi:hypothetical protein
MNLSFAFFFVFALFFSTVIWRNSKKNKHFVMFIYVDEKKRRARANCRCHCRSLIIQQEKQRYIEWYIGEQQNIFPHRTSVRAGGTPTKTCINISLYSSMNRHKSNRGKWVYSKKKARSHWHLKSKDMKLF